MSRNDSSPSVGDLFDLSGRVAVVTGASSGIGAHLAEVLHGAGATVALVARRRERLEELAGGRERMEVFPADLADAGEREALIAGVLERLGRIDVLVNNAGFSVIAGIEDESLEDFEAVVDINLTAAWHLSKLAGVDMVARGSGSVINIASILGLVGGTPVKQAGYTASKAGLINLTRELALQWGRKGVRVNAIAPGYFPTELTANMDDESSQAFVARNTALARMGTLEEMAGPLLLLASDAGGYMTGSTVVVDGGWTAR